MLAWVLCDMWYVFQILAGFYADWWKREVSHWLFYTTEQK